MVGLTRQQLFVGMGHVIGHVLEMERGADPGHNVFALCIEQVVTLNVVLARCTVPGHGNAGEAVLAEVTEHHRLHVDGGTEVMRDVGGVAVVDCTLSHPRFEDSLNRQLELLIRIGWEAWRDF